MYKSCKIQNNRFFLLICILIIIEAFSGEEIFRKFLESIKITTNLPEPINCLKLEPLIKATNTIERNSKVLGWMVAVFFFAYINLELVFSLKYWTLSLKIQSLMSREEQISSNMNKKITAIFWSLELLLFVAFVL